MSEKVYDTKQAAEILGIAPVTVRQHINNGTLKAQKLGNGHVIMAEDLEKFQENRRQPGRPSWLLSDFTGDKGLVGQANTDFQEFVADYAKEKEAENPKKRFRLTTDLLENLYQKFIETHNIVSPA
jgi:excisionase family DNA binding protein